MRLLITLTLLLCTSGMAFGGTCKNCGASKQSTPTSGQPVTVSRVTTYAATTTTVETTDATRRVGLRKLIQKWRARHGR